MNKPIVDPAFDAWVAILLPKHWARYDLSAARLGWEAHKECSRHAVSDKDVETACRAICASRGFDPDERCTYSGGKLVRGKNGEFYQYWTTYEVDARIVLESAAPRSP
jgi:hypothetical protein